MGVELVVKENHDTGLLWEKIPVWVRNIAISAIITALIHLSFVFIKRGTIFRDFDITDAVELPFTFLYFLSLFWIYPRISKVIHSSTLIGLSRVYKKIVEGLAVVTSTVLLTLTVKLLPLWLLLIYVNLTREDNLGFSPDLLRRSFIIHAIIGLFFYYFVERQRIRKLLQAEHLHRAKLQKEKFRVELGNLKEQVNPEFLFKSLDFLDSLIQKSPGQAEEFVNRLSHVYRSFLNRQEGLITIQKEAEQLDDYLYIIKCQYQEAVVLNLKSLSPLEDHLLPPGTLQLLIEACLRSKTIGKSASGIIKIYQMGQELMLESSIPETNMDLVLNNINKRYSYFTKKSIKLEKTETGLILHIPLLQLQKNTF